MRKTVVRRRLRIRPPDILRTPPSTSLGTNGELECSQRSNGRSRNTRRTGRCGCERLRTALRRTSRTRHRGGWSSAAVILGIPPRIQAAPVDRGCRWFPRNWPSGTPPPSPRTPAPFRPHSDTHVHPNVRTSLRRNGKVRPRGAREVLHHLSRHPVRVHQPLPQAQLAPEVRHPRETLVPQESPEIPKVQQLR